MSSAPSGPGAGFGPAPGPVGLLIGTKKGAFVLRSSEDRQRWTLEGPQLLGHIVYHVVLDPRDGRSLLVTAQTRHLGPTIFRSTDLLRSFEEASRPRAFPKLDASEDGSEGERKGRVVDHTFWLTPGHASEPGVWYGGTSPPALFRSEDAGDTWSPVSGWNDHPLWATWTEDGQDGTPDGSKLHSILVDPPRARAPLPRGLRRRRLREPRGRRRLEAAQCRLSCRLPSPIPFPSSGTIPTACGTRWHPTSSASRATAASASAPPAARSGRVKVGVPQPLRAYTDQRADVEASGESHVRIFVNREQVRRLDVALAPSDEVHIFQALSGG